MQDASSHFAISYTDWISESRRPDSNGYELEPQQQTHAHTLPPSQHHHHHHHAQPEQLSHYGQHSSNSPPRYYEHESSKQQQDNGHLPLTAAGLMQAVAAEIQLSEQSATNGSSYPVYTYYRADHPHEKENNNNTEEDQELRTFGGGHKVILARRISGENGTDIPDILDTGHATWDMG
ncbi:uncharacterized protein Dwil_GK22231 [Drosophila willistoni]|uniref:Uncharacterized protein n=1 Tax=Drosophila willistoni TaxID=7260 RepID=A0A0Q9WR22_DROWI|nr:uncharacterized protein Dwil_GK22231 [Drosophila willistoni]